jgi:hypothetical protein
MLGVNDFRNASFSPMWQVRRMSDWRNIAEIQLSSEPSLVAKVEYRAKSAKRIRADLRAIPQNC